MENSAAKCAMVAQGLYFEFLIVARPSMQWKVLQTTVKSVILD